MGSIIFVIVMFALFIATHKLRRTCSEFLWSLVHGTYEKVGEPILLVGTLEIDELGEPYHVYVSVIDVGGTDWVLYQYHSKKEGKVVQDQVPADEVEIKEHTRRASAVCYKVRQKRPRLVRIFNGFSSPKEGYVIEVPPRGLAGNFSLQGAHFEVSLGRIGALDAAE